jgi:hypothetical protein
MTKVGKPRRDFTYLALFCTSRDAEVGRSLFYDPERSCPELPNFS